SVAECGQDFVLSGGGVIGASILSADSGKRSTAPSPVCHRAVLARSEEALDVHPDAIAADRDMNPELRKHREQWLSGRLSGLYSRLGCDSHGSLRAIMVGRLRHHWVSSGYGRSLLRLRYSIAERALLSR